MKRDMELIRKILMELEKRSFEEMSKEVVIPGYDQKTISFHLWLLVDARLISAVDMSSTNEISFIPDNITWDGYEFLELAKNNTVWEKAIRAIKDKGPGIPFEILKLVMTSMSQEMLRSVIT